MTPKGHNKQFSASPRNGGGAISLKKTLVTGIVSLFLLGGIILLYIFLPVVANKAEKEVVIKIPANATLEMVKDSVEKYLGEKFAEKLILISKVRGSDFSLRHGAYLIEKDMSPLRAERKLATGGQMPVNIVINGSRGLNILSQKIASRLDFTPDSLLNYLKQEGNLSDYSLTPDEALSLFTDNTYQLYWSSSPKQLVEKIGTQYNKIWNEERKIKASQLGLSPAQVIVLASIIAEETNKADEKPIIARLYLNRLKKGMKLQADPTVKFALEDFTLRRIRNEHLSVDSPYNTYKNQGLPPGPIRTVTLNDIDAVLNAPIHEYIYMCAKEDFSGYHNFAKDYNTHMQNARKYQRALNQRNIK